MIYVAPILFFKSRFRAKIQKHFCDVCHEVFGSAGITVKIADNNKILLKSLKV